MMTDIPAERSFLGVPIIGTVNLGSNAGTHKTREDVAELIKPLLADDFIHSFGWQQFTPYFNDGEPCIFRARGFWVRTVKDVDIEQADATCRRCGSECSTCEEIDPDDDDLFIIDDYTKHPTLGSRPWTNGRSYQGTEEERFIRALIVSEALETSQYQRALVDLFGDHAEVTVTREGIKITDYSHHD
jgi:hypothetical protein